MNSIMTAQEATMRSMKKMVGTTLALATTVLVTAPAAMAQSDGARRAASRRLAEVEYAVQAQSTMGVRAALAAQQARAQYGFQSAAAQLGRLEYQMQAATYAGLRAGLPTRGTTYSTRAPEAWLQEDPGSEAYQRAREELNRRRYEQAAVAFAALRSEHPRSGYVGDSFYWQAFALSREAGRRNLADAAELLATQASEYPNADTRVSAGELLVRIEGQLARRGDASAAAAIARQAVDPCEEEQEIRMAALSALLNMNSERAVPILEEVLQSRDECSAELRRRAVFLISQHMTDGTVDILLDLAHRNPDPDPEVREQAIFWLHQVDTPEALDALESILTESDDPQMQERAIFAISQRGGDERAVAILKDYAMRSDVDRELRENAIFWISQHPDAGGAAFLIELYPRLEDDELRERAVFGIAQAGGVESRDWLMDRAMDANEAIDVRKNALFWAGQMGDVQAAELRRIYGTVEDLEMKEQVIFVASQRSEAEIVDFLMEVARDEEDRDLRRNAVFWLGQSEDPRVAEFLLTLIRR
jgi:HEAT repeat protein